MSVSAPRQSLNKKRFLLTALVGTFWPAMCAGYMLVILLQERGFSNTVIGAVLSANALISILVQPMWGMLSDYMRSAKRTFMLCIGCTTVLFSSLYFIPGNAALLVVVFADILFRCGLVSLLDNWVVSKVSQDRRLRYGTIRVAGSITYSAVFYFFGILMSKNGPFAVLPFNFVLGALTLLAAFFTEDQERGPEAPGKARENPFKSFSQVLGSRGYLVILVLTFFSALASGSLYTFLPNFYAAVGGSPDQAAYAQSIKALAEIPFFLLSGRIFARVSPGRMLVFGALVNLFVLVGIYFAPAPAWITFFFAFVGASYALMLTAKLQYVSQIVKPQHMATAVTLMGSVEYGLASILSNAAAGYLLDHATTRVLNLGAIGICAMGILLFCLMKKRGRAQA